ncbi:hypothetical protein [Allorhizocola rhizosphaerae]|uniref:hypothetical protein n=1 Tax=Allorhizocola rhizosphaerae TaxID=1872709 RepID=UPI000E3EA67B|nr:hypothetical protein [Allorhizocola rhizosphaerae]
MYAWLWRKLPFGLYGKLAGSAVLIGAVTALLWFIVFPWAEPMVMPWDDVQVEDPYGVDMDPAPASSPTPTDDPHRIDYSTVEPTPPSSPSRRR